MIPIKKQSLALLYIKLKLQKIINCNFLLATNNLMILTTNLENQIIVDQLIKISDIGDYFISFFLGLALKSNGN